MININEVKDIRKKAFISCLTLTKAEKGNSKKKLKIKVPQSKRNKLKDNYAITGNPLQLSFQTVACNHFHYPKKTCKS